MSQQDDNTTHNLIHQDSNQHFIQDDDAAVPAAAEAERPATLVKTMSEEPAKMTNKERAARLEQNRKAAKESRRRKKIMIEELQRSVVFFSRANSTLRQQSEELSRLLIQAQAQVAAIESGQQQQPQQAPQLQHQSTSTMPSVSSYTTEQAQAHAVATQALFESQGFPPAAARAAAQTMNAGGVTPSDTSCDTSRDGRADYFSDTQMQPGVTMQAMANFQQAAAVAIQAAMGMNPVNKPPVMPMASPYQPHYILPGSMQHHQATSTTAPAASGNPFVQWQPVATGTTQSPQESQDS